MLHLNYCYNQIKKNLMKVSLREAHNIKTKILSRFSELCKIGVLCALNW